MQCDVLRGCLEKLGDLPLRQPNRPLVEPAFDPGCSVVRPVKQQLPSRRLVWQIGAHLSLIVSGRPVGGKSFERNDTDEQEHDDHPGG